MPGIICPVVAYAPKAATKPSIAAQPLNFSASGVIWNLVFVYVKECNGAMPAVDGGQPNILVKMIKTIRKIYIKNETLINTFALKHLLNSYN